MSDTDGQRLDGKTCIVTGGAGSLGGAIARLFLTHGARLLLTDLDRDRLEAVRAGLGTDRVAALAGEVTDPNHARRLVDMAIEAFGGST